MAQPLFQHLYLLGRSATFARTVATGGVGTVTTPLPSGKVCDSDQYYPSDNYHIVSTPLPSGKVCDRNLESAVKERIQFQHLYLLGRSATL